MKTVGEQARDFRLAKSWNTTRMAKEVGTSRQNIEHLEARGDITPKYIAGLAKAMGMSVDALLGASVSSADHHNQTQNVTLSQPPQSQPQFASQERYQTERYQTTYAMDLARAFDKATTEENRLDVLFACLELIRAKTQSSGPNQSSQIRA